MGNPQAVESTQLSRDTPDESIYMLQQVTGTVKKMYNKAAEDVKNSPTETVGDKAIVVAKTIGYATVGVVGGIVVGAAAVPLAAVGLIVGVPTYFVHQLLKGPSEPPPSVVYGHVELSKIDLARNKIGIDAHKFYNVGFVGHSGVGKSSLINGLCGWEDTSEDAAKVGIAETTQDIQSYVLPKIPTIYLWDIPGGGMTAHPAQTYYEDKCLYAFDSLVLVTATRFTELDVDIAKRARADGIKVFFVRNRVQTDVEQEMRRRKSKSYQETFVIVRDILEKEFQPKMLEIKAGDVKMHLIDARAFVDTDLPQHDEQLLGSNIIHALPTGRGERR